ncbi:hypothetical protein GCM10026983_02230 [Gracilibacillus alcaliphilus]|nr:hypothetical protein [Gracilibacillus alcaliphilus]
MESFYPNENYVYDTNMDYGSYYDPNFDARQITMFPGFPPFGQGGPGSPPPFVLPGQGSSPSPGFNPSGQAAPPLGPPPQQIPQLMSSGPGGAQTLAIDAGSMRHCLFRFTYVWLSPNRGFWFYPTFLGRRSVAGFRWTGFNWIYFGIDLNRIHSFTCV